MTAPHLAGDWTAELVAPDGGRTWVRAHSALALVGAARAALQVPERAAPSVPEIVAPPARVLTVAAIFRETSTGEVTARSVSRQKGISVDAAHALLLRLHGAGLLLRVRRGFYALPHHQATA